MYHDTLVLLVLKEIFKDPYLMNYIYHIYEKDEIYLMNILHNIKFNDTKEDIQMLYPGFMKTALFENTRFNMEDDLEPGYSFYFLKPLTDCGYVVNYIMTPPVKFNICEYTDYKKDYNTVKLLNDMRKYHSSYFNKDKIKLLLKKRKRYSTNELKNLPLLSVWYDFENKLFTPI